MSSAYPPVEIRFQETPGLTLDSIEDPTEITYYSHFPLDAIKPYKWGSPGALRHLRRRDTPFAISIPSPEENKAFRGKCDLVDSRYEPGVDPVVASCRDARRTEDLKDANVVTRRGTMVECVRSLPG